jgi:hypothetical protein
VWLDRRRLFLAFPGSWSTGDGAINITVRAENRGRTPIYQIDLYLLAPGERLGARGSLGTFALQPGEQRDVLVPVQRPERVDIEGSRLVFKCFIGVKARYGGKEKDVWHPDSPDTSGLVRQIARS